MMVVAVAAMASVLVGAGEGTRTLDNQLGRLELYQLSYTRNPFISIRSCWVSLGSIDVWSGLRPWNRLWIVEGGGFEPPKA
jgi:hypothetical protein